MKKKILTSVVCLMLLAALAWAGVTNFDSVTVAPATSDTYGIRVNNSSGTRVFSADSSGNVYVAGTIDAGGVFTATSAVLTTPTITSPITGFGFTTYNYTAGSGGTYPVAATNASPGVYKVTGGSGTTTFVMTYAGSAASNAGKIFYLINSSSNSVQFKQSGATGVTVATLKIVTIVGNGVDFERITADQ